MDWQNIVNLEQLQFERDDPKYNFEVDPRAFSSKMGALIILLRTVDLAILSRF